MKRVCVVPPSPPEGRTTFLCHYGPDPQSTDGGKHCVSCFARGCPSISPKGEDVWLWVSLPFFVIAGPDLQSTDGGRHMCVVLCARFTPLSLLNGRMCGYGFRALRGNSRCLVGARHDGEKRNRVCPSISPEREDLWL